MKLYEQIATAVRDIPIIGVGLKDKAIDVKARDAEMNAAISSARDTLEPFLLHFDESDDKTEFGVKVSFDVGGKYTNEIIWVNSLIRIGDNDFVGHLANEPNMMEGFRCGSKVEFTKDKIVDWYISENDKVFGYYTVRVLLDRLSKRQAAKVRKMLQAEVLPPYFSN